MFKRLRPFLTLALALTGVAFLVVGILRGEAGEVLQKAIRVCLECIGVG